MKKILFYGNCQIGAMSEIFRLHPVLQQHFDVLDAKDYNICNQEPYRAVANFLLNRDNTNPHDLARMLNDADVFIFHSLSQTNNSPERRPEYILTENILQDFQGEAICIPSFWYAGYFGFPHGFPMLDIFVWLHEQGFNPDQALKFLQNDTVPNVHNLHQYYHDFSISGLDKRAEKQRKIYDNYIDHKPWLIHMYKHKLITYNHSHPTGHFFNYMANELVKHMKVDTPVIDSFDLPITLAGPNGHFIPTSFKHHDKLFPDMEPLHPRMIDKYNEWHNYKSDNMDRFVRQGMHHGAISKHIILERFPEVAKLLHIS